MDKLTVENFRCFSGKQTARLAPLTLLVGENSTGKTSLMALASILWDVIYKGNYLPEFKRHPFDLGTFQDIVHEEDGSSKNRFSVSFGIEDWQCEATFQKGSLGPEVFMLHVSNEEGEITWSRSPPDSVALNVRTEGGKWQAKPKDTTESHTPEKRRRYPDRRWGLSSIDDYIESDDLEPVYGDSRITEVERNSIRTLALYPYMTVDSGMAFMLPMAMAPIRSRPKRTYEQGYSSLDPGNERIPQYLAALHSDPDRRKRWGKIKQALDSYGRETGLFEEVNIRPLGMKTDSDPFQIQFKVHDGNGESSWRNIVDVGYGVSQILPVIVELIKGSHPLLLLQQPEVHLHPRAQAGLGSILCRIATRERQILVETHSDYIIDRVRMDVRDEKTQLRPDDVSILYFERAGPSVEIHNLKIDQNGNICDSPPGYRQFFMDEVSRDLGF